jgi:hypothetical protein
MPLADVEHQHVLSFDLKTASKRVNKINELFEYIALTPARQEPVLMERSATAYPP